MGIQIRLFSSFDISFSESPSASLSVLNRATLWQMEELLISATSGVSSLPRLWHLPEKNLELDISRSLHWGLSTPSLNAEPTFGALSNGVSLVPRQALFFLMFTIRFLTTMAPADSVFSCRQSRFAFTSKSCSNWFHFLFLITLPLIIWNGSLFVWWTSFSRGTLSPEGVRISRPRLPERTSWPHLAEEELFVSPVARKNFANDCKHSKSHGFLQPSDHPPLLRIFRKGTEQKALWQSKEMLFWRSNGLKSVRNVNR